MNDSTTPKRVLDYETPQRLPALNLRNPAVAAYWLVTAALFAAGVLIAFFWVPEDAEQGPIQRIFYLHLPVAINTFLAFLVCFVASIGYLYQRDSWWDDLAAAGARVGVQLCAVVLITGMIWGRSAWGVWWTWSPRLTFSLVLFLLYVVYLVVRSSVESGQRRAIVSAVYAIVAFLDVPLVYLSTRLMPEDIHPRDIALPGSMKLTLALWFIPVTLAMAGMVIGRFTLSVRQRARQQRLREIESAETLPAPASALRTA